jgi:uncharacterized membrane protein
MRNPGDRQRAIRYFLVAVCFVVLAIPHTTPLHRNVRLAIAAVLAAIALYYLLRRAAEPPASPPN